MKVNGINTFNYSNINTVNNNHKQYATRPVFKQNASVAHQAIVDQFIESADEKKQAKNPLYLLKDILFSTETTRRAKELKETIDSFSYDSTDNILYKI